MNGSFRHRVILLAALLPMLFVCASAAGQNKTIDKKKAEAGKLQEDIKFLDNQISQTRKKRQNTLEELKLINRKVDTRKKLIDKLEADIRKQRQKR